jgi:hypothetical protein
MKFTFRDIVWAGIIVLVVVFLSKCHRDRVGDLTNELAQQAYSKDSTHRVDQQQADNKLNILLGQMQNAAALQQATDKRLSQSLNTIARLSAGVKTAKLLPEDTTFTMVSPEYIDYCDSLAITSERVYDEYEDYKRKTDYSFLAKDTAFNYLARELKQERSAYATCRTDYTALQQAYKRAALPHNQLYLGAELIGSPSYLISNVGAVISIKTKSNKLWQLSGGLQTNGQYYGRINGNILISLKR